MLCNVKALVRPLHPFFGWLPVSVNTPEGIWSSQDVLLSYCSQPNLARLFAGYLATSQTCPHSLATALSRPQRPQVKRQGHARHLLLVLMSSRPRPVRRCITKVLLQIREPLNTSEKPVLTIRRNIVLLPRALKLARSQIWDPLSELCSQLQGSPPAADVATQEDVEDYAKRKGMVNSLVELSIEFSICFTGV